MEICARFGLIGLFPLDNETNEGTGKLGAPLSMRIFRGCIEMMEDADAAIAHLTPFRGPARGKICTGYSNRRDSYADRIERAPSVAPGSSGLVNLDCEGHIIENFGLPDNLMVVHAFEAFGHPIMAPHAEPADIWRDLTRFEKCADWIARQKRGDGGKLKAVEGDR